MKVIVRIKSAQKKTSPETPVEVISANVPVPAPVIGEAPQAPMDKIYKQNFVIDELPRFGFWVESVYDIKKIFTMVEPVIKTLEGKGFQVKRVSAHGGVHEKDTGYEVFDSQDYNSFEEAKEKLPRDFSEQEDKLDGMWFGTLNFETFSVELSREGELFLLVFSNGKLYATGDIKLILPSYTE